MNEQRVMMAALIAGGLVAVWMPGGVPTVQIASKALDIADDILMLSGIAGAPPEDEGTPKNGENPPADPPTTPADPPAAG